MELAHRSADEASVKGAREELSAGVFCLAAVLLRHARGGWIMVGLSVAGLGSHRRRFGISGTSG